MVCLVNPKKYSQKTKDHTKTYITYIYNKSAVNQGRINITVLLSGCGVNREFYLDQFRAHSFQKSGQGV